MFGDFPQLCYQHSMAPGVPQTSNDFATKSDSVMLVANIHEQQLRNFTSEFPPKTCLSRRESMELIGVVLVDERSLGKANASADGRNIVLGTVCVESKGLNLEELRRLMCTELPCLPASFHFLTRDGWPIHKLQEHKINSSHVIRDDNCICIKKEFEKSRIGVVTSKGDSIGFVFTDLNINIKQLRETIEQQLKLSQQMRLEYRFVEKNGWPVMSKQESSLSLLDIMLGQIVCIQSCDKLITTPTEPLRPTSLVYGNTIESQLPSPQESIGGEKESVKRVKSIKFKPESQFSIKLRKDGSDKRPRIGKTSLVRPILISYVRAEAAQYALDLKQELVSLGFSVYLDVHEIKTGSDWQDALNHAVTHCFLFVPLITPMYGKTQWTNREVKLADVLGKMIIPVNFMDHWPPPCLAIQFASTQYIPWKLQESDHVRGEPDKTSDHRHWDRACVKRVSRQIADCFKDYYFKLPKRTPSSKEVTREVSRPLLSQKGEDYYSLSKDDYFVDGKQSIVISAHPRQRYLAQDLKEIFEKIGHEVWCSVDLLDQGKLGSEDVPYADPNTPRNLPTIQEGDVFFNQTDVELFDSGVKTSSMYKENETYGRRPLSRLMSQFSDISQPSTLSREKLDQLHTFQQKVDQAAVIIVLVSAAYTKSTFSHQQVFYCEHRKRVVLVNCDSATIPKWFRLLMGNDMIMKKDNPEFESILKTRVKRALNPSSSETPKDATAEAKMNYLVNFLKKNLPLQDLCVYVAGSSKLQSERAEEICRAIGRELAKVERVSLVTGGFFGAADITAKTFYECRENNHQFNKVEESVVHILPMRDSEDFTAKARQNLADGSFETIPYGKTVFLGDSVKERETVVARLLDTCLVIEGGPGVVHEVEEFIWNDHFVIPIMSTGGAASGCYGVPVKIFELPPGVDESDWSILSERNASPETVAKSVVNIMVSLKKSLSSPSNTLQKSTAILKRKSKKKLRSKKQREEENTEMPMMPSTSTTVELASMREVYELRKAFEMSQCSSEDHLSVTKKKSSWWRRFLKALKHK